MLLPMEMGRDLDGEDDGEVSKCMLCSCMYVWMRRCEKCGAGAGYIVESEWACCVFIVCAMVR